jgi:hypothetical protein
VVLFPDLRESPYCGDLLGSESALAAALEVDGRLLGTLAIYDRKSEDLSSDRSFGEVDREMMVTFATQAAKGLKRFHPFVIPASWVPVADALETPTLMEAAGEESRVGPADSPEG